MRVTVASLRSCDPATELFDNLDFEQLGHCSKLFAKLFLVHHDCSLEDFIREYALEKQASTRHD